MDELPSDVVRNIYVKYCGLRNADEMKKAAQKVAVIVSDYLVHTLNTTKPTTYNGSHLHR